MKKLNAYAEPASEKGSWIVGVTDADTGIVYRVKVEAPTEKDAVFKAMEQINDR